MPTRSKEDPLPDSTTRILAIEEELGGVRHDIRHLKANIDLSIQYMQAIAQHMGLREKIAKLDDLFEQQKIPAEPT